MEKIKFMELLFCCNEYKKINSFIDDYDRIKESTEIAKKTYCSEVCSWLAEHRKEDRYLIMMVPLYDVFNSCYNSNFYYSKLSSDLVFILIGRKKDIIEKRRTVATWTGIIVSFIIGLAGIILNITALNKDI